MKFWRPGITGKLFLAIFATCIVLLITMHWAVRISFERALSITSSMVMNNGCKCSAMRLVSSTPSTGTGASLHIALYFRSYVHWSMITTKISPAPVCHHTAGARNFGWLIKIIKCWLAREHQFHPTARRPIMVNGAEVGAVIASPVERLTRNTDINFDRQQRQTSWLIVALSTLLAALATFHWRAVCWLR